MAAVAKQLGSPNGLTLITETVVGPNTTTVYSSVIKEIKPDFINNNRWATIVATLSDTKTGTVTVDLYGSDTEAGTEKSLLKSSAVGSITTTLAAIVDLNAYPAPFYFLGVKSTGNDSGIDVALKMLG